MLVFGLGFFIEMVVSLLGTVKGCSVSISIGVEELVFGAPGMVEVTSLGVEFDVCCDEIGNGGDKRGRFGSGGDDAFVSLSPFGS